MPNPPNDGVPRIVFRVRNMSVSLTVTEFNKGVELLSDNQTEDALEVLNTALALAQENRHKGQILYNIAVCHLRMGSNDLALHALEDAVSLQPWLVKEFLADDDFSRFHNSDVVAQIYSQVPKRPTIVTVVSVIILIWGVWVALGFLMTVGAGGINLITGQRLPGIALFEMCVAALIRIVGGAYMLAGRNWARQLFIVGVPIQIAVGAIIGGAIVMASSGVLNPNVLALFFFGNILPYGILALLLSTSSASRFFVGPKELSRWLDENPEATVDSVSSVPTDKLKESIPTNEKLLQAAISDQNYETVVELLSTGVDIDVKDQEGYSLRDYARMRDGKIWSLMKTHPRATESS